MTDRIDLILHGGAVWTGEETHNSAITIGDGTIIAPGYHADLAVLALLNDNLFTMTAEDLPSTQVDMTLFDGDIVYQNFS